MRRKQKDMVDKILDTYIRKVIKKCSGNLQVSIIFNKIEG